jgi:hypothetical protein
MCGNKNDYFYLCIFASRHKNYRYHFLASTLNPKTLDLKKLFLRLILSAQTTYCWWCFFETQSLPYDDNYTMLLSAIFISAITWITIGVLWKWKRDWLDIAPKKLLLWAVVGSPFAYILAFIFYSDLFGPLAT